MLRDRRATRLYWNDRQLQVPAARRRLTQWLNLRHTEEIAAALPLRSLESREVTRVILNRLWSTIGDRAAHAVSRNARLLARTDLRSIDRETDRADGGIDDGVSQFESLWGDLVGRLSSAPETANELHRASQFLEASYLLGDKAYAGVPALSLLLMTRPPSAFDIATRWAQAELPVSDLASATNAIRGTRYALDLVRSFEPGLVDISSPVNFGDSSDKRLLVVLANLRVDEQWAWEAAQGRPIATVQRAEAVARVVNQAIECKRQFHRSTILLLPELSLPRKWCRAIATRLLREDISLVAGLEYREIPGGQLVVNEAIGSFAVGLQLGAVCFWKKSRPARHEGQDLFAKANCRLESHSGPPLVVNTDEGTISLLICSELLDVELRGSLLGRIDLLLVPSWNPDTSTFDHTIRTTSNDLHCYVAVANNASYSDCRAQAPKKELHEREVCRLISRGSNTTITAEIDVASLRAFQLNSLADPLSNPGGFKPIPPGFRYSRP